MPDSIETNSIGKVPDKAEVVSDTIGKANQIFPEPVQLNKIKQLDFLGTTSGVLGKSETGQFCRESDSGFFGFYHLLYDSYKMQNGKRRPDDFIGMLRVFTTDKPEDWRFDTKNETFVEIELLTSDIPVWDSIRVGTSEGDLLKFIGENFHYKKGTIVYAELGDFKANFTITEGKISKLKVGRYCK